MQMPTLTTLASFNGTDGDYPSAASLIADAAGDLLGTTGYGGAYGDGTVFEIVNNGTLSAPSYASTPTVLASFNGPDGTFPNGSLIADANGDLFGATNVGDGTVFEIVNNGTLSAPSYASTPTVLVNLNGTDGQSPNGSLIADAAGDLFETTEIGSNGYGTVFEIAKTATGYASTPTVLVSFNNTDGANPTGGLIADANGDLFSTTVNGGAYNFGTVFEIAKTSTGFSSTPTVLVSFNGADGAEPQSGLVADPAGDLFGETVGGGANNDGVVFEIAKTSTGYASTPTVLVSFNGTDGSEPFGSLIADAAGDLFGTTESGGAYGDGTVFEIAKTANGYASTPTTLVSFNLTDGSEPFGSLIANANGDLFGVTFKGGAYGDGTVFELTGILSLVPTITSSGGPTNQTTQTISGTVIVQTFSGANVSGDAGLMVSIYDGSTLIGTVTPAANGNWSTSVTLLAAQGAQAITAQAADAAGNVGTSSPVTFTLDTIAPTLAITSTGGLTNQTMQTIAGTIDSADAGLTVSIYDGSTLLGTATPAANGNWSKSVTLPNQSANLITAQATDAAGNVGTSSAVTYTLDNPTIIGTVAGQAISDKQTDKPFSTVTVTDAANPTQTQTLTVTLSNASNGVLSNLAGGTYNAATGVYTDIGIASVVATALDGLVFTPTAHQVAPGSTVTTTFTIGVNDGIAPTVTDATTTVVTTAVENLPTINGAVAGQTVSDNQSDHPFATLTIGSVDNPPQTLTLTVTLSAAANGTLSNLGGGYYDPATGVYTISGTAAGVTAALDALVFTPTTHQVAAGSNVTTTFSIGVTDGLSPIVSDTSTSVVATGTANTTIGPTVAITGTDALVKTGSTTTTTIVGTVSDNVQVTSVELYNGSTDLGAATLNANGSWSFAASFGAGTYDNIVAVATDVNNNTSTATAPFTLITGITGAPYTSQEKTFDSAGTLIGRTYFTQDGSVFLAGTVEQLPDGGIDYLYATGTAFEGQTYTSYRSYFSGVQDNAIYEGTTTYYTGISGQAYNSVSVSVDAYNELTEQDFTGVTGAAYSSYEYDYVAGIYDGAKFEFTTVPTGATYSSYETDYNFADAFTGDKFFFTNLPGQPYTGEEEDFDANGALTRVLITGVTGQSYSSLELDYSAGTYTGYKAYYTITGQPYTGEEVDVSAANAITKAVFTGLTDTPYSSVEEDYSNGAVTGTTYYFTDQTGQNFYAYQAIEDAGGNALQEIVDNDDGSHTIVGYQDNQTFTSIANDTFTGGGANETFVFTPIYGHDTITDFVSYLTGTGHDTISLSTSEFANFAAVLSGAQNVGANVVITAPTGDTITLDNVSKAMLSANAGDFTFHA
jgi:uncharacterized repeat protein (TIGR03803 family)